MGRDRCIDPEYTEDERHMILADSLSDWRVAAAGVLPSKLGHKRSSAENLVTVSFIISVLLKFRVRQICRLLT